MTPAMKAALAARSVMLAGLMQIELPGHTIRLVDGGTTVWQHFGPNGAVENEQFVGRDPLYGVIGEVDHITEGVGDTIPGLEFKLIPPSFARAVQLCNPVNEGSPFYLWMAVVDRDTGFVLPEPELQFAGEFGVPTLEVETDGAFAVRISIDSVFEQLFEPDEGVRLADSFHQYVQPGELGMSNMTSTPVDALWGPGNSNRGVTYVGS